RAAYLDRACAGDPALRGRVDALLAAAGRTGSFMARPAPDLLPPTAAPESADPAHPQPTLEVGRADPEVETRDLLRRRLLVVFSILAGACGAFSLAERVADVGIRGAWWSFLLPGLRGGLVALLAG